MNLVGEHGVNKNMPGRLSPEIRQELSSYGLHFDPSGISGVIVPTPEDFSFSISPHEAAHPRLGNEALPVYAQLDVISDTIAQNAVTVLVAETGAGKTTQVPQRLLEDGYSLIHLTQPRRAAARSVFERIRDEISGVLGGFKGDDCVSFQIAGEREGPEDAPIRIVTDGLQLVKELSERGTVPGEVLIIDEAHEANTNVSFLLGLAKDELKRNPHLKVVVMSATIDAQGLSDFFSEVCEVPPPIVNIEGKLFDVEKTYKPESTVSDEVVRLLDTIPDEEGEVPEEPHDILVFAPGKNDIEDLITEISRRIPRVAAGKVKLFPLHAKLSSVEQSAALTQYPGTIRIVVATNVAETSLTPMGIKYVVDSGLVRRVEIDDEGTRGLYLVDASQAELRQRKGRTGRVCEGEYYLTRLNRSTSCVPEEDRIEFPAPELLRTDASRSLLRFAASGIDLASLDLLETIPSSYIELAKRTLTTLGAFDEDGTITNLGHRMNRYPVDVCASRMLVESRRFEEPVRAYLAVIAACGEAGNLQYYARNAGQRWKSLTGEDSSDLLVQLDLFLASLDMSAQELREHDLDISNVQQARDLYWRIAKLSDVPPDHLLQKPNSAQVEQIRECIYAGYLPHIYKRVGDIYVHAWDEKKVTPRELGNRSLVYNNPPYVLADPYWIELVDNGAREKLPIIQDVTSVALRDLGRIAATHVISRRIGYVEVNGRYVERRGSFLFGNIQLGVEEDSNPAPSPELRAMIIADALRSPGAAQRKIREIKQELEWFAQRTRSHVPQLTHDYLVEIVEQAAPTDIVHPSTIEEHLWLKLVDQQCGLSIDDFISPEQREKIIQESPDTLEHEGVTLHISYSRGNPYVSIYSNSSLLSLESSEVRLPDGREVLFSYANASGRHGKHGSLGVVKAALQARA